MIKLKSIAVIILSSILISVVIGGTIAGLSLYFGYVEGESARGHADRIERLNARSYSQYISIQDLQAKREKEGVYKGKCLIEGVIKNNGYRTIGSIRLSVDFLNASGDVIYSENFYPLKVSTLPRTTTIAVLSLFTSGKELPLLAGEAVRFKQILSEQKDKDIVSPIKYRRYATNPNEWSGRFDYRITAIKF